MPSTKRTSTPSRARRNANPAQPKMSRQRRPDSVSVEEWQIQLRRQYGRDQDFVLEKLGTERFFGEYLVLNPLSEGRYRLRIGGLAPGENDCSCPDFSTNDLGTCKHIEFALGKIEMQRGAKSAFKRGFQAHYSELYLDYAGERRVRLRLGAACSAALRERANALFDADSGAPLAPQRYAMLAEFLAAAHQSGDDVRCRNDALGFIAEWRDAQERAHPRPSLRQRCCQRRAGGLAEGRSLPLPSPGCIVPIMLRRRKAEVLEQLPARVDKTLFVPMTMQQNAMHDDHGAIVQRIVHRWRKSGFLSDADQRRLTCSLQTMRMACNSTFLVDHETDHGSKVDELMNLIDDLFEDPAAKVVVFSQWLRTHELIERRLASKGWGHVLLHGAVAGQQRGALVDRFNRDPACRVFLSTDAGAVGLNLQYAAATIVNMDLPWNPAVLEQRIGRVHRIGQTRGVQVMNFVSQGTIEEGTLSVLAFKKSLFDGVLDGGASEIFMQGTRLSQFMDSVDAVTQTMGQSEAPAEARQDAAPPAVAATDPWAPLLDAGLQLVTALAQASDAGDRGRPAWIETDGASGKSYIKLPVPDAQTVQRLATALGDLIVRLAR